MAFETVTMPAMTDPALIRHAIPADARLSTWTAPDGWPIRRLDWPGDGRRGRIMVQGGRGDFIEKYLETLAHFHAAGWSVSMFDWRGQGGSGRLSPDPHVGHASSFTPWVSDLTALWRDWSREGEGPRAILGHSMGGFLVLRALADAAIDPDAAVLVAPMLGLRSFLGQGIGGALARFIAGLGDPARAAWKHNERPASLKSRQRLLTHDLVRYADARIWHETTPAIRLGPPSWGWLAEAFTQTAALAADPRIETIRTPILALVGDHDGLVDPGAARRVIARLPDAQLVRFGSEAAHEILHEVDPVRDRALALIDAFLAARAGP